MCMVVYGYVWVVALFNSRPQSSIKIFAGRYCCVKFEPNYGSAAKVFMMVSVSPPFETRPYHTHVRYRVPNIPNASSARLSIASFLKIRCR